MCSHRLPPQGCSFCLACKKTFGLITSFTVQLAVISFVQWALRLLQSLAIPCCCAWIAYEVLKSNDRPNPIYGTCVVLVAAFIFVRVFASVFECAADTSATTAESSSGVKAEEHH